MKQFYHVTKISSRTLTGFSHTNNKRRVVCSGIGIVSPLGCGTSYAWENLINGKIAVTFNDRPGFESFSSKVAAFVPTGNKPGEFCNTFTKSERKYLSLGMMYALIAAEEALGDADWKPTSFRDCQMTGVTIGCVANDANMVTDMHTVLQASGHRRVSPYFIPKMLNNMGAGNVSIKYGFHGPNYSVSTACTTGTHSVGDATRMISYGDANVMVCGAHDSLITTPLVVAGLSQSRALSTSFNETPELSSRPFDSDRDGFVMGEGAAVLVLEEYEHALKRKCKIYGEVLGYGMSGDGFHITAPHKEGLGAVLCMQAALKDANVKPHEVSYVNAHATSTPIGDLIENNAIKKVFGNHSSKLKISSFKGAIGHLCGAAGTFEIACTLLSLYHKIIPPTMNIYKLNEEEFDLDYVPNQSQPFKTFYGSRRIAVKNSFGFGGTNACLCLAEMP